MTTETASTKGFGEKRLGPVPLGVCFLEGLCRLGMDLAGILAGLLASPGGDIPTSFPWPWVEPEDQGACLTSSHSPSPPQPALKWRGLGAKPSVAPGTSGCRLPHA